MSQKSKQPEPNDELTVRGLTMRAATLNEEARSVEADFSTETPSLVYDWDRGVIEEVLLADGVVLPQNGQVPMLEAHSRFSLDDVLGAGRDLQVQGGKVTGRLVFAKGDERAERAWNKVKQGVVTDVSVGYRAAEFKDIKAGRTEVINGRSFTAGDKGLRVTTKWHLREISLVPIGADSSAKIREEVHAMDEKKETPPAGNQPEEKQRQEPAPAAAVVDVEKIRAEIEAEAKKEVDSLREDMARTDLARTLESDGLLQKEIADKAITEKWATEKIREASLQFVREQRGQAGRVGPGIVVAPDASRDLLAAGLKHRAGIEIIDPKASDSKRAEQEKLADQSWKYRDMPLHDLCRFALMLDGKTVPVGRDEMVREAVSSGTLLYVFTDSVNARLMSAFGEAPDVTGLFCAESDVADFKTQYEITFDLAGSVKRLPSGGTAEHLSMADGRESYKVNRYASKIVIDEQDIINDNIGAVASIPEQIGRMFAAIRQDLVFAQILLNPDLADSAAVFNATFGNGAATAFGAAGVKAGITAMRKLRTNGRTLNILPKILLVPATLEWDADQLMNAPLVTIAGTAGAVTEKGTRNPLYNRAQVVVESRLENGVTNPATGAAVSGSAAGWYLFADPATAATIRVAYRAGTGRRPQLRSYVLDKGQWGLGWDCVLDIGAAWVSRHGAYRGGVAIA